MAGRENNRSREEYDILSMIKEIKECYTELGKKIENLERKVKALEKTRSKLLKRNQKGSNCESGVPATDHEELKILLEETQLDLMEEDFEITLCKPYEDFFADIYRPLQYLLGLEGKVEGIEEKRRNHLVQDRFASPFLNALQNAGGEIKEGKFRLPPKEDQRESFCREDERKKLKDATPEEMKMSIDKDKIKLARRKIALQKKSVVQGLGRMIAEFQDKTANEKFPVDSRLIDRFSAVTRTVLELNEIYPMFIGDAVSSSPELKQEFDNPNEHCIPYPGFFIKNGEKWELLGDYRGMGELEK